MKDGVFKFLAMVVLGCAALPTYADESDDSSYSRRMMQNNCPSCSKGKKKASPPKDMTCLKEGYLCSNARGCHSEEAGGYIVADLLVWLTDCRGFSYANNVKGQNPDSTGPVVEIERMSSVWDPGFRIGAGWETDWDSWDVLLNWTWFRSHASGSATSTEVSATPGILGLFPQWPAVSIATAPAIGPFRSAHASYTLLLNAVDLEVSRSYYLTRTISFDPFWGARGAWLRQRMTNKFAGPIPSGATVTALSFKGKNHNWGLGPRVGFSSKWDVGSGFSLFGRASTALLYGRTNVFYKANTTSPTPEGFISVKDEFNQLVPTLQLQIGFNWLKCFDEELKYYAINLSWETNYWWDQFNLPTSQRTATGYCVFPTTSSQPVTLEGITLEMIFGF